MAHRSSLFVLNNLRRLAPTTDLMSVEETRLMRKLTNPEKHSPVQSSRSLNRGNHFHVYQELSEPRPSLPGGCTHGWPNADCFRVVGTMNAEISQSQTKLGCPNFSPT